MLCDQHIVSFIDKKKTKNNRQIQIFDVLCNLMHSLKITDTFFCISAISLTPWLKNLRYAFNLRRNTFVVVQHGIHIWDFYKAIANFTPTEEKSLRATRIK